MIAPTQEDLVDFVDTASVGLHWVAADGTILWANPADYEPLGYSEAKYIGRSIVEFHADANTVADILRRLTAGERLQNYEARLLCKNGSTRNVLISSSVRHNGAGEFLHTRCFTVDVSHRRPEGLQLQIEALSREVERLSVLASRDRGLVEAILTHSPHGIIVSDTEGKLILQNKAAEKIWAGSATADSVEGWGKYRAFHPLNAMLGWASLLRTSKMSDERREHALETIERNARAQAQLIDDLLDVSRIISGNLRLELRTLDLATIIESALDALRLAADSKGVRLQFFLDEEARQATGDPSRLQQVVWNLLSNAVKFTDRGGVVTARLCRTHAQAEIRVSDTGRGIDAAFLPHVFERFKQANGTTTRTQGGLGLGLAIVKHLVELHGGTVSAASAGEKQGSVFSVRLPLSAVQLQGVNPAEQPSSSQIVAPSLEGVRVLVVDDEPDARLLLAAVLEGHGAEVCAVGSAADALREIERAAPDVLVSDIGMPNEDGYGLIRSVRVLLKKGPAVLPALALTAYARMEDRSRAMLAGFQAHVAKPIDPDELLVVVATLVGRTGGWTGADVSLTSGVS